MNSYPQPRHLDDFHIAVICALPREYDAVVLAFDEIWDDNGDGRGPALRQHNNHMLGRIGVHDVVLVLLPNTGKVSAANEVVRLRSIYVGLEIAFLTGICGGVPSPGTDHEVLLGDVVMGKSIVQYDLGRQYPGGFRRKDGVEDNLSRLNKDVRSFLATYETQHGRDELQRRITKVLERIQQMTIDAHNRSCYDRPAVEEDSLFEPTYLHRHRDQPGCSCSESTACDGAIKASCQELGCDVAHQAVRRRLESKRFESRIHVGCIGSGDTVMKSGEHRDRVVQEHSIIAFEMEGAGVWEEIPCIIVKGVCDYADSHKNKLWQDFAAAMAASATKALMERYVCRTPRRNSDPTPAMFTLAPVTSGVVGAGRFVGRGDELGRLHEALKWTGERRTAVLHGLGGMGKTQLSIEYTKRHRSDYSATIWLNARDEMSLKQSFQQAARRILREHPTVAYVQNAMANQDLDETTQAVKRWLDEVRNDRWLVVYDNYDDVKFDGRGGGADRSALCIAEESGTVSGKTSQTEAADSKAYDIRPYFPETDHGAIVITTRSSTVKLGQLIRLSKLGNVDDGLAILESTSDRANLSQSKWFERAVWVGLIIKIDPDAYTLARRLDGLPLALSTAGAYLNQVSTTCAEYLRLYNESWLRLHEESPQLLDYDQALYSTWGVSVNHIQQQSRGAAMLLRLWAYFDNEDLWYELLQEAGPEGPLWLQDVTEDKLMFNATMRVLCEHGLVEANPPTKESSVDSQGYSVHGCVHAWMIHVLNTGVDEEMSWTAMRCVASHVPSNEQQEYWMVQRRLLQHADRCITRITTDAAEEGDAWMFDELGLLYSDQGRLKEAEAMYERALQGYEKARGPEHTSTLGTVNNLGNLFSDQGRLKEAEAMYQRALQGKEKAWGPDHTSTLDTVGNLGNLYSYQGRLKEAEAMYERALQGYEKARGPDHTSTLDTVNNLGLLYSDQGRLKEAEAMYERVLQGYEKALGPDAIRTYITALYTLENFGSLFKKLGENSKAISFYQRAQNGFSSVLGPQSERCTRISDKISSLQPCAQEMDVSLSVEKAGRGLKARWNRMKGQLKGT